MKVFGFPISPFVRKVHLVAAEKGVEVEMVLANPRDPSDEFLAASPFRKIPALTDGDFHLADSTAICAYLDALHPAPANAPGDARTSAKAVWFEEVADTVIFPALAKVIFNRFVAPVFMGIPGDEALALQGIEELQPSLAYLEGALGDDGWLTGGDFSIGDIAVASCLRTLVYGKYEPDAAQYPKLTAWYGRVQARPSWIAFADKEDAVMKAGH